MQSCWSFQWIHCVPQFWIFVGITILFCFFTRLSLYSWNFISRLAHTSLCSLLSRQHIHNWWGSCTSCVLVLHFISLFFYPMHLVSVWLFFVLAYGQRSLYFIVWDVKLYFNIFGMVFIDIFQFYMDYEAVRMQHSLELSPYFGFV